MNDNPDRKLNFYQVTIPGHESMQIPASSMSEAETLALAILANECGRPEYLDDRDDSLDPDVRRCSFGRRSEKVVEVKQLRDESPVIARRRKQEELLGVS